MMLILNANPISRKKVESGVFCLRENENMVDLNRNYEIGWEYVYLCLLLSVRKKMTTFKLALVQNLSPKLRLRLLKQPLKISTRMYSFPFIQAPLRSILHMLSKKKKVYLRKLYSLAELYEKEMEEVLGEIKNQYC